MINNENFEEQLSELLDVANVDLLPQVESLVMLKEDIDGKKYNLDSLDSVINIVIKWQRSVLELFLVSLGEKDSHTTRFMETMTRPEVIHNYDPKRSLKRAIIDSASYIEAIMPYINQIRQESKMMGVNNEEKKDKAPKLFISHSSKDKLFMEELVTLLEFLGFKNQIMFCSSVEGYGIPLGNNIFDYLRTQFNEYQLFVLFIHSPRYYESCVSLNEMGAAWVLKQRYFSILTKDMSFDKMTGVVTNQEISIKVDTADVKLRLNELRDALLDFFSLQPVNESRWETIRDKFIKEVTG